MTERGNEMKKIIVIVVVLAMLLSLAIPTSALAKVKKWDLEGWRVDQGKWMDGLLWTWYECSQVPYRLVATEYDGSDITIAIQHDFLNKDGEYGVDEASNFFIGLPTDRKALPGSITPEYLPGVGPGDGVFWVDGPYTVEISNGWLLEYRIQVNDAEELINYNGGDWAIYWEAHPSATGTTSRTPPPPGSGISGDDILGSAFWSGASLHAHTGVTGNQDVPIKTPPQEVDDAAIDVEKLISIDIGETWIDADTLAEGPVVCVGHRIKYLFIVTNIGDVPLANITLSDSIYPEVSSLSVEDPLAPGQSFERMFWYSPSHGGTLRAVAGEICNTATATGDYAGTTYYDMDDACYTGNICPK
jgi:uncharacterized repeat protein (TIGR01451 family)